MEEFLERQGRNRLIALASGFMGPDRTRFEGKWYRNIYMFYKYFTDISVWINFLSVLSHVLRPEIPLIERCLGGFPLCSLTLMVMRMTYLYFTRPKLVDLIQGYMNSFKNDPDPMHLETEMTRGRKFMRPFPIILFMCNVASMAPWCGAPFLLQYLTGERKMSVPADFPVEFEKSPNFEIITFIQILGATLTPMKIIASDDLFYALAFFQLAQFRHLKHNFGIMFNDIHISKDGQASFQGQSKVRLDDRMEARLRQWIIHHQETSALFVKLQGIFSFVFLITFGLQTLVLCLTAFIVAVAPLDKVTIVFCAFYVVGNALELLFLCRVGDFIIIESGELTQGLAGKNWFVGSKKVMTFLKICLSRCYRPHRMSAFGVFPLDTDTFKSIIISSYSYFTMLVKIKK